MRIFLGEGAGSTDILGNESLWQEDDRSISETAAAAAAQTGARRQAEDSETVGGLPVRACRIIP